MQETEIGPLFITLRKEKVVMPEKKLVKDVELTRKQKQKLKKLWMIYGNNGKKSTKMNHSYIQGFIEQDHDRKAYYEQGKENMEERGIDDEAMENIMLTDECVEAVESIVYPDK